MLFSSPHKLTQKPKWLDLLTLPCKTYRLPEELMNVKFTQDIHLHRQSWRCSSLLMRQNWFSYADLTSQAEPEMQCLRRCHKPPNTLKRPQTHFWDLPPEDHTWATNVVMTQCYQRWSKTSLPTGELSGHSLVHLKYTNPLTLCFVVTPQPRRPTVGSTVVVTAVLLILSLSYSLFSISLCLSLYLTLTVI